MESRLTTSAAEPRSQLPQHVATAIERFTGRTWLLTSLLDWLERPGTRGIVLTGDPGTGKSMVAAWLAGFGPPPGDAADACRLNRLRSRVKAAHFCVAGTGSTSAQSCAESLARQLTHSVQGFGAKDGSNNGSGNSVRFTDGRQVFTGAAEAAVPAGDNDTTNRQRRDASKD